MEEDILNARASAIAAVARYCAASAAEAKAGGHRSPNDPGALIGAQAVTQDLAGIYVCKDVGKLEAKKREYDSMSAACIATAKGAAAETVAADPDAE